MNKLWQDEAWADYLYWQQQDKKLLKRINQLLKDIDRSDCPVPHTLRRIAKSRGHGPGLLKRYGRVQLGHI